MVKRYTNYIPQELAGKLKEVGMPIEKSSKTLNGEYDYRITYAEVIDWLMEKGVYIIIFHRWSFVGNKVMDYMPVINETSYSFVNDWHEAANKAIEFAINKIKEEKK